MMTLLKGNHLLGKIQTVDDCCLIFSSFSCDLIKLWATVSTLPQGFMSGQVAGYKSISMTVVGKLSLDEFHLHHIPGLNSARSSISLHFLRSLISTYFNQTTHSKHITAEGN